MKRHTFPLALTAVLSMIVLTGCGGDDEPTKADDPATSAASQPTSPDSTASTPSSTEPAATETTTDAGSPETTSVPVYFVGDTPQGTRLYSEQREVEADNPPGESVALLMAGDVTDPDYRTLVPAGSLGTDVSFDGTGADGFYTLNLTDAQWAERPAGMSKSEAQLAVQQIVYTLLSQAAAGDIDGAKGGVDFYLDGERTTFLGVAGTASPAASLDVRALVNVSSPAEGETVNGSFQASGAASSFEATVPWEIRDDAGAVVQQGFATADGWADKLYPWQSDVDVSKLDPGTYTFVALTDDPSDGEGAGPTEDSRTIVVE
ncbi:Gmad2 immunoglobulin-like domain-containing protein [Nocardioides sp. MH1]|uniref:Gmad2 immunoglobulin-like domain-containing protein n=1 Tax=Nocardioides sp. MH1 TaxID=3242490 RepID=UPI0035214103